MGACALLGSLMVPEMMRRGYNKYLSIGPIMGVGGLAVIIPPSALTVLLATLGRTDVGDLLIAGIVPGFVLSLMYGVLIWVWTVVDPDAAPRYVAPPVERAREAETDLRRRRAHGRRDRLFGRHHADRLVDADGGGSARCGVGDRAGGVLRHNDHQSIHQFRSTARYG